MACTLRPPKRVKEKERRLHEHFRHRFQSVELLYHLRDDGVGYGDYLEQLTYLIFLKMADEYAKPPYNRDVGIPVEYNWPSLKSKRAQN